MAFQQPPRFSLSQKTDELDDLLEEFKKNREGEIEDTNSVSTKNVYRQTQKLDLLIVMENVSRLADKSNAFASFLINSQKLRYSCVYIFHIIYPEKTI